MTLLAEHADSQRPVGRIINWARIRRRVASNPWTVAATLVPGMAALAICLYQLSLFGGLFGIHGPTNGRGYDDGVYLGVAVRLIHGLMPYKDFFFAQPPGISLLMAPVAALGDLVGSRDALAIVRVVTAAVAGVNAGLAALAVRHRGAPAMFLAGSAVACFPLAVAADHTLYLEPYLVLFCLIGLSLMFVQGAVAPPRRVLLAGAAFGFATSLKLWGAFVVAAGILLLAARYRRRLLPYVTGAVAGFSIPCLPFFVASPHAFVRDIFTVQFGRLGSTAGRYYSYPASFRVSEITGLPGLTVFHPSTGFDVGVAIAFATGVALIYAGAFRRLPDAEWMFAIAAALSVAGFFSSSEFYDHYAYFTAPLLAILLAVSISRLVARIPRLGLAPVVMGVAGLAFLLPQQAGFARTYLSATTDDTSAAEQFIPAGACVLFDDPDFAIDADRYSPAGRSCPGVVDPFGLWLADAGFNPTFGTELPDSFVTTWAQWLERADYVMLVAPYSDYIPWTNQLMSWFSSNYRLVYSAPNLVVYQHVGGGAPPAGASDSSGLIQAGLAAEQTGSLQQAIKDFQGAAKADPSDPTPAFDLAVAYQKGGLRAQASAQYRTVLLIDPRFTPALSNLAALEEPTDPATAIYYYELELKITPADPRANVRLGVLLIQAGETIQGYTYLDRGLRLDPALRATLPAGIRP